MQYKYQICIFEMVINCRLNDCGLYGFQKEGFLKFIDPKYYNHLTLKLTFTNKCIKKTSEK